jgi:carboxymethylenebutenolidase
MSRPGKLTLFAPFCILALVAFALIGLRAETDGVPISKTQGDELPPAIIGNAGPLAGESIAYFDGDPKANGYIAVPQGEGPFPSVILIHEWNGLVERVKETADSFAAEGYVALAVDLYSGRLGTNQDENMKLVMETLAEPQKLIDNLNAAVAALKGRDDTTGKVATIGWCYGGGVALSYALGGEHHDATAIFYGRLLGDPEQMAKIGHPVYGTFVENDRGIPVEDVDKFVETLRAAGIPNDVHIYDEVNHGFWLHVDRDAEKNTPAAIDAWKRLKKTLDTSLH